MSLKRALPREKYLSLQRQLQRSGELYEDRDFPPNFRSLFTKTRPSVNLQWKRPKVCLYSAGNTRLSYQVLNNLIFLVPCWNYLNHVASPLSSNPLRQIIFKSTRVKSVFFSSPFCKKKNKTRNRGYLTKIAVSYFCFGFYLERNAVIQFRWSIARLLYWLTIFRRSLVSGLRSSPFPEQRLMIEPTIFTDLHHRERKHWFHLKLIFLIGIWKCNTLSISDIRYGNTWKPV